MKSRQILAKYVHDGYLIGIEVDEGTSKRYAIKGEHILTFKEKYDKGLIKAEKYSVEEMKMLINRTLDYCEENGIVTLRELINKTQTTK